ncbi:MAG: SIR2 family NAD-dependent protein deacylase [Bacteroidales bacterium]
MRLVFLTGAGMSQESGLKTFRDSDGLWENYNVEQVASIEGWYADPQLMTRFYNERRIQLASVKPNLGHVVIGRLESSHDVTVITQNVDDLHERAGSSDIIHLHGELTKVKSNRDDALVKDIGYTTMEYGEKSPDGGLWRPDIVWFGEAVPMIPKAAKMVSEAELLVIVGTSMNVYPAAGLVDYVSEHCKIVFIDPYPNISNRSNLQIIEAKATEGLALLEKELNICTNTF